jgi:hypothetical protein
MFNQAKYELIKCEGGDCPFKKNCAKYLTPSRPGRQQIYTQPPVVGLGVGDTPFCPKFELYEFLKTPEKQKP